MQFLLLKRDNNNFNMWIRFISVYYLVMVNLAVGLDIYILVQFYSRIACLPTSDFEAKIFYLCAESWT